MIEIYLPNNEDYTKNGDMVLNPTYCDVSASLANKWYVDLHHLIDDLGRWKYIVENAVIRLPSFNGDQLFRIRKVTKNDSGVTAEARPIWLDAQNEVFLLDTRPTKVNGQRALDRMLQSTTKYTAKSNITKTSTAYYILKDVVDAIMSADNAFITRWGGEILYDNYTLIVNEHIGSYRGVDLLYGKNIPVDGLSETVDMDSVVTRIIPKAFNGYILPGTTPWVDSKYINFYPVVRTKVIEYPHIRLAADVNTDETDDLIICETFSDLYAELRTAAEKEFETGIDAPLVTMKCNMVLIQNTEEYKDYKEIEKVSLGDTIYCNHYKLGIRTSARVTEIIWDAVNEEIKSVTIGIEPQRFISRVAASIYATEKALTKDGKVVGNQIEGTIDMGSAQLRYQKNSENKQDVRGLTIEDIDRSSSTFGAVSLGTQGLQLSKKRNGDSWIWSTAITSDGIRANHIVAGRLTDKKNSNYWDLDTGKIVANDIEVKGTIKSGSTITGSEITASVITSANGAFKVDKDGKLFAESAVIKGSISAGSVIAGATIEGGTNISNVTINSSTITDTEISSTTGNFKLKPGGNLSARYADLSNATLQSPKITSANLTSSVFQGTIEQSVINQTNINGGSISNPNINGGSISNPNIIGGGISSSTIENSVVKLANSDNFYLLSSGNYTNLKINKGVESITYTGTNGNMTTGHDGQSLYHQNNNTGYRTSIASSISISGPSASVEDVSISKDEIVVRTPTSSRNGVWITKTDIELWRNGTKIWSASESA